jgi:hypothetical protein
VAPGGIVTVDLTVTPAPGAKVGAIDFQISYDNTVLSAIVCTTIQGAACNAQYGPSQVAVSAMNIGGINGEIGTVTFNAIAAAGSSAIEILVSSCGDETGEPITCEAQNGSIQIAPYYPGDVDCNNTVNAIDALKILRHSAQLSIEQPAGCPAIGPGPTP